MSPRPIEDARNIGPICGAELRSIGIHTVEELQALEWEEAYEQWVAAYPDRIHTMAAYALLGATEDLNAMKLPETAKRRAKKWVTELKRRRE